MIQTRPAGERGTTRIDWLDSRHTFSFGDYRDPRWSGFRTLRVLNDDRVRAASGFGSHGHRDMEIVSLVLDGALEHKDSIGTGSVVRPGEIQRMSAGTGIVHSEWNPLPDRPVHFLQIWFLPRRRGRAPGYEQTTIPTDRNAFRLIASGGAQTPDGAVTIDADADLWRAALDPGSQAGVPLARGGHAWVHVVRGTVDVDVDVDVEGHRLTEGDGAAISDVAEVRVRAVTSAEVLVFDLG